MAILLLIPFGILSDRYGRKPMILYPRAIMFIGTLIRVFARTPYHLIIAAIIGGFAGGSYFPVLLSMIADISNIEQKREGISTLFLVGVSFGAFRILSTTLVANNSVPENRGLANSIFDFGQSTGNFMNIFTSSMAENVGIVPVFLLGGITCLSAIIPTLRAKLGR
jgi:MFS family permease